MTVQLKTNFIGTTLAGGIACEARLAHGGRTSAAALVKAGR